MALQDDGEPGILQRRGYVLILEFLGEDEVCHSSKHVLGQGEPVDLSLHPPCYIILHDIKQRSYYLLYH